MARVVKHMPDHVHRKLIQHRDELKRLVVMEHRTLATNHPHMDVALTSIEHAIARRQDAERAIIEEWHV
jgi:hypothetical protein